ncbi:hypothetical protein BDQ12DRAFT_720573 [Crucibulum laeve]|uniref:G-protein coupled receptors family 3 profile domain-containing protein n=1 Tax=Crucibulum laeve TaxID=68775 RepID=A0A5C3M8L4_9AGAR|nr:hypothetical protein BDQ12DRAFT_720573 [Crucibulum laeve]
MSTLSSSVLRTWDGNSQSYDAAVHAFIAMQLIGVGGLTIITLTAAFSRSVKRLSTWYSFCASWIISGISYSLLTLAGQQTGPEPAHTLCVAQAALIYAVPPLTASTTLALVIHMLMNFRFILSETAFQTSAITLTVLLVTPYSIWLVIFVGVVAFEAENPGTVRRAPKGTYCDSTMEAWSKIASISVVSISAVIVVIQTWLAFRLYRNQQTITSGSHWRTTVIRVMVFSFLGVLALAVAVAYAITSQHDQAFDLLLASLPVLAVLIFGTQMDLVRVWAFWRYYTLVPVQSNKSLLSMRSYASVPTQEGL